MPEIDDNTKVAIPLRNLVALGAGIVMATTAYVTLDTRCLLYTSPSPRDRTRSRMPSSA